MYTEKQLNELLTQYPEYVSKEKLRLIAHISKRVARELLIRGIIPCKNSGKRTRNYTIAMVDIIAYLREREVYPEKYYVKLAPLSGSVPVKEIPMSEDFLNKLKAFYGAQFLTYPDVVNVTQASGMTGHSHKNINHWCKEKKFVAFPNGVSFMIPKISLIEFMIGSEYRSLKYKSKKQREAMHEFEVYYSAQ
ncbi:MAG: hypothetical protein VB106_02020 [Clostridiaceae bacterium]|nr:hypothetical protein [Clostridiaceae bacterium]